MLTAPLGWFRRLSRASQIAVAIAIVAAAGTGGALIVATGPGASAASQPPRSLPAARNFSLTAVGEPGHRVSLSQYQGRPLIVNFFASWCAPCQRETPLLASFYRSQHGQVALVGIDANDHAATAAAFLRKSGVSYPVGSDPFPATATTSYGVLALPQTFFINAQHRIVLHVVGPVSLASLRRGLRLMDAHQERG